MLEINTWRDPYDAGFSPTRPKKVSFNEGMSILIGCNGAGKSTLLHNIKKECETNNIPVYLYDNLKDGGKSSLSSMLYEGNFMAGSIMMQSSEGENIKLNIGNLFAHIDEFLKDGVVNTKKRRIELLFKKDTECNYDKTKRVLLFDAIDSGLSIDGIVEFKDVIKNIQLDAKKLGIELYIIAAANEYELARDEQCFDVNTGKYISISSYESYRKFILKSSDKKKKRLERQEIWYSKKQERLKKKNEAKKQRIEKEINKIKQKAKDETRELFRSEEFMIEDYERELDRIKIYDDDY